MVTCKFRPMYSPHLSLGVTGSVGVEVVADRARRSRFAGSRTGLWKDGDQAKGQHGWNKGKQTFRSSDKTNLTNPCGFNSGDNYGKLRAIHTMQMCTPEYLSGSQ